MNGPSKPWGSMKNWTREQGSMTDKTADSEKLIEEARDAISPDKRWTQTEVYRTELIRRLADTLEASERRRLTLARTAQRFAARLAPDPGLTARSERADVESRTL